ncbi:MAG TPA: rhomboid family intramembrane serine protease [Bryobacteraceae bacterium]
MSFRSRGRATGVFYVPGFPPGVKWLLIGNVAIFIIGYFTQLVQLDKPLSYLVLSPVQVVKKFYLWQLATYLFLHGGFGHILWNMLALWMFGADLESDWGTRKFLRFYFYCGIGAGICVVLANYILPWGNPLVPTIGSSGAIFGILLAYAMLYPTRTILFAFLIPIQVKYFVMIIGAISFMMSFQVNTGVSEFAHLGGMLFGYIFLKTRKMSLGLDVVGPVRDQYRNWKLQRAKKKFQVYLRKQGSPRDPTIH